MATEEKIHSEHSHGEYSHSEHSHGEHSHGEHSHGEYSHSEHSHSGHSHGGHSHSGHSHGGHSHGRSHGDKRRSKSRSNKKSRRSKKLHVAIGVLSAVALTMLVLLSISQDRSYDKNPLIGNSVTLRIFEQLSALNNEGESPELLKLLPQDVLDFYNQADYPSYDYSVSHLEKEIYPYRADIPVPYKVKWSHEENAMRTVVSVDTKAIGSSYSATLLTYEATGLDSYPLYNLLPDTVYYYKVMHVMADGSVTEAKSGSFMTSAESVRLIYIEGTQNVRDLGGWTGLDGRKVKYGKIFRGASLSDSSAPEMTLTGKGKQALGELRIGAELNLGAVDTETSIAANCSYKKIGYTNYATAITNENARAQFKEALEYIVACLDGTLSEQGLPTVERNLYIHCQGGCDRTGTLVFQLLGLLGVSESDLAKEYELSSFSHIGYGRLRTTRLETDTYDYAGMVEALKEYEGNTLTEKFYSFATKGCGISEETIAAFRNLMLE